MVKRLVGWLVLLPLAVFFVLLALANRTPVPLGIDPFSPESPLIPPLELPLFVILYGALILGILLGGFAAYWAGGRSRREKRRLARELKKLEQQRAAPSRAPAQDYFETEAYEREA